MTPNPTPPCLGEREQSEKHRNDLMDSIVSLKTERGALRSRLAAVEAERDAAIARAEEAERKLAERPLTASGLADALGCFSNAAIGAMHSGTATECAIAQGIQAVAWRLEEISKETKT